MQMKAEQARQRHTALIERLADQRDEAALVAEHSTDYFARAAAQRELDLLAAVSTLATEHSPFEVGVYEEVVCDAAHGPDGVSWPCGTVDPLLRLLPAAPRRGE